MRRPSAWKQDSLEVLEDRVVPSTSPSITVGVLGDSYSDEYRFNGRSARNWVEQLAFAGKANFGAFSTKSLGAPRNQGYVDNWALSWATSTDMVKNQLPGLTRQVASGKVSYVNILVGANDFLLYFQQAALNPPSPQQAQADLARIAQQVGTNIQTAVQTLLAASPTVRVVVDTLPSLQTLPIVQLAGATPQGQALVKAADELVSGIDTAIASVGQSSSRVAVLELASEVAQLKSFGNVLNYGGARINLKGTSNDYRAFFLPDGLHLGSVGQGLLANEFLNAINGKFHLGLRPFTPTQIVRNAAYFATHLKSVP